MREITVPAAGCDALLRLVLDKTKIILQIDPQSADYAKKYAYFITRNMWCRTAKYLGRLHSDMLTLLSGRQLVTKWYA